MAAGLLRAAQRLGARVIEAQAELIAAGNRVTGVRLRDADDRGGLRGRHRRRLGTDAAAAVRRRVADRAAAGPDRALAICRARTRAIGRSCCRRAAIICWHSMTRALSPAQRARAARLRLSRHGVGSGRGAGGSAGRGAGSRDGNDRRDARRVPSGGAGCQAVAGTVQGWRAGDRQRSRRGRPDHGPFAGACWPMWHWAANRSSTSNHLIRCVVPCRDCGPRRYVERKQSHPSACSASLSPLPARALVAVIASAATESPSRYALRWRSPDRRAPNIEPGSLLASPSPSWPGLSRPS